MKRVFLILSWSLYDLANQFFALNVISLYFPSWLTIEKKYPEILYSIAFVVSMLLIAVCAPILGAISDARKRHKGFLIFFTLLSIVFTAVLGFSPNVFLALVFFALANFGCQEAVIFYNSLLVNIAPPGKIGLVSGVGRMFGYTGAVIALILTKPIVLKFGYKAVFLISGILFLIFALPCMIFVKDKPAPKKVPLVSFLSVRKLGQIFKQLKQTLFSQQSQEFKNFLKAAFFGLCAVNTVILFMSVYVSKVFGLNEEQKINLIIFAAVFAIISSFLSGFISDLIGYRRSLKGVFILWGVCFLLGGLLRPPYHWLVGALGGTTLGATWVICRAVVIKLVPREKIGEAFGLFNMVGYLAAIGPLSWSGLRLALSFLGIWGYRLSFISLILFIAAGFVFLNRLPAKAFK